MKKVKARKVECAEIAWLNDDGSHDVLLVRRRRDGSLTAPVGAYTKVLPNGFRTVYPLGHDWQPNKRIKAAARRALS